jgi:DNA-binding transcriptional LysR family regulator
MDYVNLSRISLKHLTTLHVMLSTRSVTLTASRLCVSPSSISKTLAQLRELLNDELFYRDGSQLVPTPYVQQMGPTLHSILSSMNGLLHQAHFDAKQYTGHYKIAMSESTVTVFAKEITKILRQCSDELILTIHAKERYGFDSLLSGDIDFIILPHDISQPPTHSKELIWETLLNDQMICVMRTDHPLAGSELTIDSYLNCRHIAVKDHDLSVPYFEQNLTQRYHPRNISITTSDFGSAAILCEDSELLLTCSKQWAVQALSHQSVDKQYLILKTLPFDYGTVGYSLVWNKRSMNDSAMKWLCEQLRKINK